MLVLFKTILSLSLSGTILILLLFVCRPLYRNRLSKRWQYYIWLLVIARLLLPITPETSLIGNLFRQAEQLVEQSGAYSPAHIDSNNHADIGPNAEDFAAYTDSNDNANIESNAEVSSTKKDTATDSMDNPAAEVAITYSRIGNDNFPQSVDDISESKSAHRVPENTVQALCILWLVAALLLFVRKITVYQSFVKYVIAGSKPVDDITLLERFGQIMTENHIKGTVELCVNDLVSSPLLIGFTHARVVLPTIALSEDDFYYTALHELIHYKRRDMFYKWVVQLTICLHWFNPFAYLMGREINRTCELSCDERVIATLSDKSRKSYGDTLLNAIGTGGSYQDTLASVTLNESKELLKGRLEAIMKYKKIPKAVQTAAVFITGILVGGAAVLGAYAAPTTKSSTDRITLTDTTISFDGETTGSTDSTDSQTAADTGNTVAQDSNAISHTPDYIIEFEDGIFYILTGGATEADKPLSTVTNGYSHLVLVRKDEYHSFGSWRDSEMKNLVRHITPQCRTSLKNGRMTQEDMDIVIAASTEIQEAYRSGADIQEIYSSGNIDFVTDDSTTGDSVTLYNYIQSAYYQAPYIIEIGYNLTSEAQSKYSSTLITLSDQRTLPVFFSTKSEKYISDATAMSAVTALIERIVPKAAKSASRPLEYPFIVSMEYVGETNMDSLAEKYYDEEMLTYFGAIFLELDTETQQNYLDHMYEDENISFFACCIGMFERTDMSDIQRKKNIIDHYILKAYEEGKVDFFAVLSGELDEESRKNWLEKCKKDGRADYFYILSDEYEDLFDDADFMDDTDYFDEWNEFQNTDSSYEYLSDYLEDKGLLDEYNQNDIITIKDAYYYHNARVRLLVDVRSDGSFENFNYNVRGTVDLRLVRDKNNDIVRVEYLSTEEAAEIIEDINDSSVSDDDSPLHASSAPNILDLTRITKQDVSTALLNVLDSCDSGKWYVITENDCQYIYYNGLPHTYAYEPHIDGSETGDLITIAITDINVDSPLLSRRESVSDYVLLLFSYTPGTEGKNHNVEITYNKAPVTYDTISVASGTARSIADLYTATPQTP